MLVNFRTLLLILLLGSILMQSCTYHLLVKDNRFVKTESGYLLLFENKLTDKDTGVIYDPYLDKLSDSINSIRTVFLKDAIDTSLSKSQIIEKIKTKSKGIEFGSFCERIELLSELADTLLDTQIGTFYFIPGRISFLNSRRSKLYLKTKIIMGNNFFDLKVPDGAFQLINVIPFFNSHQYQVIRERSLKKKRMTLYDVGLRSR